MKKIYFLTILLMVTVMSLSGCFRQYITKAEDMYVPPSTSSDGSAITIIRAEMNPALHLSEGGNGRDVWASLMWDKNGKEVRLKATLNGEINNDNCKKIAVIVIDKPLAEIEGNKLAPYLNHSGTVVYNILGDGKQLKSIYFKMDPEEYKEHLFTVSAGPRVMEIKRGTALFDALFEKTAEINKALSYTLKKYGPHKTKEELEQIAFTDTVVYNLMQYLGNDWYAYITTGITLQEAVVVAGVMKLMKLPSVFGDKINREGYSEFQPDSGYIAEMFFNGFYDYGVCIMQKAMAAERKAKKITSDKITEEQRQIINSVQGNPCANAETVSGYNKCVREHSAKVNR